MIWRNFPRGACLVLAACLGTGALAATPGPTSAPLPDLMAGEFALQASRLPEAARSYARAAAESDDPAIAERAARIAMAAQDDALTTQALARWNTLAPESVERTGFALQYALAQAAPEPARREARRLLATAEGWRSVLALLAAPGVDVPTARTVLATLATSPGFPREVEPALAFAGLARRLGDSALAQRIVDTLARAAPDDPRILVAIATLEREAGRPAAARAALVRAQSAALAPDVRRAAAGELAALGDRAAAATLLAAGPQDDTTYMSRAAWLAEDKDLAGLATLATEVKTAGLTPAHRLLLGQIAEVRGAWTDAETWYRSVPPGVEGDRARLRIGATLEQQGKFDAGIAWWRALETDPGVSTAAAREAFLQEAQAWARHDKPVEALAAFDRGLARFADDAVLLYGRAMEHVRRERVDAALADLKHIIDRNAEHADALNAYGYTLAEYRERYAEALPFVEKSNRLQPHSSATLDSLGWIRLKLGQPAEALALLREAWALGEDPEIAAHLGEALWLAGDKAEARRIWARGAELDPKNRVLLATRSHYDP